MMRSENNIDLAVIRARLATQRGRQYWRSLDELARTPEFQRFVDNEFPAGPDWHDGVSRRRFLQLMGASLALAGLQACGERPREPIMPYVRQPEQIVPGKPLYFATAHTLDGYARGLLVESHEGRPTKIEGNPLHPASPGPRDAQHSGFPYAPADIFAQASLLTLYDPDRSQTVLHLGRISTWNAFQQAIRDEMKRLGQNGGAGVRILTETITSPTLAWQLTRLLERFPEARWHQYDPVNRDAARRAAIAAFGQDVAVRYAFDRAVVVLSLDSDFLTTGPAAMRYAHDFMNRRRVLEGTTSMNRLYVVEPTPTNTGAVADHRLPLTPDAIEHLAEALAAALTGDSSVVGLPAGVPQVWFEALLEDLRANQGQSIIVAGEHATERVQLLAHVMNELLGNVGRTIEYTQPIVASSIDQTDSLRDLAEAMRAGQVQLLIMLGGNPAYNAPADVGFAAAMERVPIRVHQSLYVDETSFNAHWHVPLSHELETWSDARAYDGTVTIMQPLIAPLYEGRSMHELLAVLLDQPDHSSYRIVREFWSQQLGGDESSFEAFWQRALHDGVVANSRVEVINVQLQKSPVELVAARSRRRDPNEIVLVFRPDPTIHDGRFANNGWLQELPKSITKLTWDNALLISPALAEQLGIQSEQIVEVTAHGRVQHVAVWITPGQCDKCITLHLGYGRTRAGNVGNNLGFNAYALRLAETPWHVPGATLRTTADRYELVRTQHHQSLEGRPIFRELTFAEFLTGVNSENTAHPHVPLSLYEPFDFPGSQWGMAIDLTACIGCQACVIACQSENNIPVVGKEQVAVGREMHWIRIDTYFEGQLDNPATHFQPVTCMHCENAPCEPVCPVGATQHSHDGLNEMVYNRCIGTRYCSNNCPYKVRRFNFLQYVDPTIETHRLMRNPNVSVRSRGVMEKCTYCVQRIRQVDIAARRENNRSIRDDEVITACQAVCPTQAIIFGNINDPDSRVAKYKRQPHDYTMLAELNTQPRTSYLARVRNPHPRLASGSTSSQERHG